MLTTVYGNLPPMPGDGTKGAADRMASSPPGQGQRLQVTSEDGTSPILTLHPETEIRTLWRVSGHSGQTKNPSI